MDNKNIWIVHFKSGGFACIVAAILNIIAIIIKSKIVLLFPVLIFIRWLVFDECLNLWRGESLGYVEEKESNKQALTDRILSYLNVPERFLLKFTLITLTYILYAKF